MSLQVSSRTSKPEACVALLSNHSSEESFLSQPMLHEIYLGACERANSFGVGCRLVFAGSAGGLNGPCLTRHLESMNCKGLILAAINPACGNIELDWTRFSVVKVASDRHPLRCPSVGINLVQGIRLAFERIKALGYSRVGLAVEGAHPPEPGRRCQGLILRENAAHLWPELPHFSIMPQHTLECRHGGFRAWARSHELELVVTNSERMLGLPSVAGLRIPEDMALAWLPLPNTTPLFAGLTYSYRAMGLKAVDMLSLSMKPEYGANRNGHMQCFIPATWNEGHSAPGIPGTRYPYRPYDGHRAVFAA